MVRALLFDFDGLLLDTETPAYESWCEVYREFGVEFPLSTWVSRAIGLSAGATSFDPVAYLAEQTGVVLDGDEVMRLRNEHELRLAPTELCPGVSQLLEEAHAAAALTAIVTSDYSAWVMSHLDRIGVTHPWDAIVCADGDAARGKPRPTLYLEALDRLAVRAAEAIAFEDSPNGVRAAKAAGLFCVAVPNTVTRGAAGLETADLELESLSGVTLAQLSAAR
jgi:HAD superfamily hydrolase (TIGR01509 family)